MKMPENEFGPGNAMMAMSPVSRAHEPGLGLGDDGWRVLTYRDLVALDERPMPEPQREIVLNARLPCAGIAPARPAMRRVAI